MEEMQSKALEEARREYLESRVKTALYYKSTIESTPRKCKVKKKVVRRGHNYRRRWLVSKEKERNSNKNKSSGMNYPRCWDLPRFRGIRSCCKIRSRVCRNTDVARAAARQELVMKRIFKHLSRGKNQPYGTFSACWLCNICANTDKIVNIVWSALRITSHVHRAMAQTVATGKIFSNKSIRRRINREKKRQHSVGATARSPTWSLARSFGAVHYLYPKWRRFRKGCRGE